MKWGMEVKCRKLYQLPLNQSLSYIASDMGLEAQVIDFIGRVSALALQQHLPAHHCLCLCCGLRTLVLNISYTLAIILVWLIFSVPCTVTYILKIKRSIVSWYHRKLRFHILYSLFWDFYFNFISIWRLVWSPKKSVNQSIKLEWPKEMAEGLFYD